MVKGLKSYLTNLTGFGIAVVLAIAIPLFIVKLDAADLTTDACPGSGCVVYNTEGQTALAVQITGTFSGTLTFSTSVDGTNFVTSQVTPVGALGTPVSTTTGAGIWTLELRGHKSFKVAFTTFSSGTAVVTFRTLSK